MTNKMQEMGANNSRDANTHNKKTTMIQDHRNVALKLPKLVCKFSMPYRENGKHYLINSQNNFSGKVIDYLIEINSYQVNSGNEFWQFPR